MITLQGSTLIVKTPYNAGFVQELKVVIPETARKFDPGEKAWLVDPAYGTKVQDLIMQFFGQMVMLPQRAATKSVIEQRVLEVRYLGSVKARVDGSNTAYGFDGREWSVIIPEEVLRNWFDGVNLPQNTPRTLYGLLGIAQTALQDEIKTAYRRMARHWHPDVCKEPDAKERFQEIQHAYEVLGTPNKRTRYDAGLALEATLRSNDPDTWSATTMSYRPNLRCGYILAEGSERVGRFVVSKILAWEDIINSRGQVLLSSWPMGARRPLEVWS
jgi:hypothetical protein